MSRRDTLKKLRKYFGQPCSVCGCRIRRINHVSKGKHGFIIFTKIMKEVYTSKRVAKLMFPEPILGPLLGE